jgi:hypothetical protein
MPKKYLWAVTTILGVLATTTAARAGSQLESVRSTCSPINCSGMTMRGVYQSTEPFVFQIFARAGECLRLDVSEQTADMTMLVVFPAVNIEAFADDRGVSDARPLVAIDGVDLTGWYTVIVSQTDGDNVVARFELEYGRYPAGNANCAPAATEATQIIDRSNAGSKQSL